MTPSEELFITLKNDSQLVTLLGGIPRVFFIAPPVELGELIDGNPLAYPWIVFDEANNKGSNYADNLEYGTEIDYNVSVVHNSNTNSIANRVVTLLKTIGYERNSMHDLHDAGVFVKAMRFTTIKEIKEVI